MEKEDKKPYLEKQVHKEYLIIHNRHKTNIVSCPHFRREIPVLPVFWINTVLNTVLNSFETVFNRLKVTVKLVFQLSVSGSSTHPRSRLELLD